MTPSLSARSRGEQTDIAGRFAPLIICCVGVQLLRAGRGSNEGLRSSAPPLLRSCFASVTRHNAPSHATRRQNAHTGHLASHLENPEALERADSLRAVVVCTGVVDEPTGYLGSSSQIAPVPVAMSVSEAEALSNKEQQTGHRSSDRPGRRERERELGGEQKHKGGAGVSTRLTH